MELKVLREKAAPEKVHDKLAFLANAALRQIDEKYDTAYMRQHGIRQVMKFGIAFWKKEVEIICRVEKI